MSGIGCPSNLITEMTEGTYTPFISDNMKIAAAKRMNSKIGHDNKFLEIIANLEDTEVTGLKAEIPADTITAGNISVIGFTKDILKEVEKKLSEISGLLLEELGKCKW